MVSGSEHSNCYILAGGKSSRMGTDKGLLPLNNKALISYVLDKVKPIFKATYIVTNNTEYAQFGLELIPDQVSEIGPAGGILSALQHSNSELNLIVSCDMPFISTEAIRYLLAHSKGYEITVPIHDQKLEPLFALYSSSCNSIWRQEVQKEVYKLQNLISNFKSHELDFSSQHFYSEELFMNINTQEDLEKASKKLENDY